MSMDKVNPYAAPQYDLPPKASAGEPGSDIWRDGDLLAMRKAAALPDRCVICNAPAKGRRLRLLLRWFAPVHLLGLSIPLIERRAQVKVGICPPHRWRRRRAIALSWLAASLSLVSILSWHYIVDVHSGRWYVILLYAICGIALIAALFSETFFSAPPVKAHKIEESYVWLKKVHPEYLAQFPPFSDHCRALEHVEQRKREYRTGMPAEIMVRVALGGRCPRYES
ncbi:MAG TPA: hypothetical protein VHB99_15505 [Pirellulales bacterium]|nr:hypothetical protein [Pirellulales bacterium]